MEDRLASLSTRHQKLGLPPFLKQPDFVESEYRTGIPHLGLCWTKKCNANVMLRIIRLKYTGMKPTDAIGAYVEKKFAHLDKFVQDLREPRECAIELGMITTRHRKGDVFRAEANFRLPLGLIRAERTATTLYAAIDDLRDELEREITSLRDKQRTNIRKGARRAKEQNQISPLE